MLVAHDEFLASLIDKEVGLLVRIFGIDDSIEAAAAGFQGIGLLIARQPVGDFHRADGGAAALLLQVELHTDVTLFVAVVHVVLRLSIVGNDRELHFLSQLSPTLSQLPILVTLSLLLFFFRFSVFLQWGGDGV